MYTHTRIAQHTTLADFEAKPMVLLVGGYSVGKTSFLRSLVGRNFPGIRIGPVSFDRKKSNNSNNSKNVTLLKRARCLRVLECRFFSLRVFLSFVCSFTMYSHGHHNHNHHHQLFCLVSFLLYPLPLSLFLYTCKYAPPALQEPTTDRFTAIMHSDGGPDRTLPGHALAMQSDKPFHGLQPFGNNFLTRCVIGGGVSIRNKKIRAFECLSFFGWEVERWEITYHANT